MATPPESHSEAFVGRGDSFALLDRWFDEASSGQSRLVVVRGEAGVGKTRLARRWLASEPARNARLLLGAAHEDVLTPFLPLAAALDGLPGLGDVFTWTPRAEHGDRAELSLFLAVTRALMAAAARRPTVLMIDDVHWADQSTMELLAHLVATATHVASARLLVLLTERIGGGTERVQAALRRLESEPTHRGFTLYGLDELELHELVTLRCAAPPSPQLLHALHEATAGNPLLVEIAVDQLAQRGLLDVRAGRLVSSVAPGNVLVHPGATDAWQSRLAKVGEPTRRLLELAAVLGDGGSILELQAITGLDDATTVTLLAEAGDAGLLDDDGATYRFHHPLLRRAIIAALGGRRRTGIEAEITARLADRYRDDLVTHALVLAEHAYRAEWPPTSSVLDGILRTAADQAIAVGAWGLAGACYERALATMAPDDDAGERAVLELRAGQALRRNFDYATAYPHLQAAAELAELADDHETWGEALFWLTGAEVLERVSDVRVDEAMVARFVHAAGDEHADARALVLANVAQYHFSRYDMAAAVPLIERAHAAVELAERAGTRHLVATVDGLNRLGSLDLAGAETCFRDAIKIGTDHEDQWQAVWTEGCLPLVEILAGRLGDAETSATAAVEASVSTHQWTLHGLASACLAATALGRGRVADAEDHATTAIQSFRRSDYFWAALIGYPHLVAARAMRGAIGPAHETMREWSVVGGVAAGRTAMLVELMCGDLDAVRALAERYPFAPLPSQPGLFSLLNAVAAVEVGARLDDVGLVEDGYAHLTSVPGDIAFGIEWCLGLARVTALGATVLGRFDDAARWIERAHAAATSARSPLEAARTAIVKARLARLTGEPEAVGLAILEPAHAYLRAAGLPPFVVEIEELAPELAHRARVDLVILWTDLVSSTELNVRVGDTRYLQLRREHDRIVRQRLHAFSGVEFTHAGDGVGARFVNVDQALTFAVGLQADFDDANTNHPDHPLRVRVGLAKGSVFEEDGALIGQTVVRAVRICATAEAGQVLVDEEVAAAADPSGSRFTSIGSRSLKGFPGMTELFEVRLPQARDYLPT
jgi:class 3 adenylate cyclase/tetratricopeptide (TPR) repeat protein